MAGATRQSLIQVKFSKLPGADRQLARRSRTDPFDLTQERTDNSGAESYREAQTLRFLMKLSKTMRDPTTSRMRARQSELLERANVVGRVHLRRRQTLPLDRIPAGDLLHVERGCIVMQAPTDDGRRRIALVLFPGDVVCREVAPPLPGIALTAATAATVTRSSRSASDGSIASIFARLASRAALHAIVLNELNAEQKLATFLVEMALRFGTRTPAGCSFELPLSRSDIAHYLALNPDTMSRLSSRLRANGLIMAPTKGWTTLPHFEALAALTPLAGTLRRLWPSGDCGCFLDQVEATTV